MTAAGWTSTGSESAGSKAALSILSCKYLKLEAAFEHECKKPYICSKLKNREDNEEVDYI
jgi:hypothetical protein